MTMTLKHHKDIKKKGNLKKFNTSEYKRIFIEEEIKTIISMTRNLQEKALFSFMYETGARIGEVLSMKISSISEKPKSYQCTLFGMSGYRNIRLDMSKQPLCSWLRKHPEKDIPSSPLWGHQRNGRWYPMEYQRLLKTINRLARKAGIHEKVYPHILRHSRISHMLSNDVSNNDQIYKCFGLIPSRSK